MASDDQIDADFEPRYGNDTPPLMSRVPEPPPSHWGKLTSRGRTASEAYLRFLENRMEAKK